MTLPKPITDKNRVIIIGLDYSGFFCKIRTLPERKKVRMALYQSNQKCLLQGFPGGAAVESLPANSGDAGSSPGLGRSHMPRSN